MATPDNRGGGSAQTGTDTSAGAAYGGASAAWCLAFPGLCWAAPVPAAGVATGVGVAGVGREAGAAASRAAERAQAGVEAEAGGFFGGLSELARSSAAPIEQASSAARWIAAAVAIVAIVAVIIVLRVL